MPSDRHFKVTKKGLKIFGLNPLCAAATRGAAPQGPRDTVIFFWFVLFHVEENERIRRFILL
jgi:hypothetical protein